MFWYDCTIVISVSPLSATVCIEVGLVQFRSSVHSLIALSYVKYSLFRLSHLHIIISSGRSDRFCMERMLFYQFELIGGGFLVYKQWCKPVSSLPHNILKDWDAYFLGPAPGKQPTHFIMLGLWHYSTVHMSTIYSRFRSLL